MGKKKIIKKGKKPHKNKPTSKKYAQYKIEGDKITKLSKFCPRCGPGVFLLDSQGRLYCGKCHYTEFQSKKVVAKVEEDSQKSEKKE